MRFLVDEDVAVEVARCLQQAGHEVLLVAETLGLQTDDVDIWHHAVRTAAIVITCNRQDFLELAGTEPETGLIVRYLQYVHAAACKVNHRCLVLALIV